MVAKFDGKSQSCLVVTSTRVGMGLVLGGQVGAYYWCLLPKNGLNRLCSYLYSLNMFLALLC